MAYYTIKEHIQTVKLFYETKNIYRKYLGPT